MYLVYEKNYLNYGDVDCVEEADMKLWSSKKKALADMQLRKGKFIEDEENDFTFMENESSDECFVFADELQADGKTRTGEFHICLVKLQSEESKIKRKRKELENNWTKSEYNEDTDEQLDYYIDECHCEVGDKAYLYSHENDEITEMVIAHIICRMDDIALYNKLLENEDVLIDGEDEYNADTSTEFITDNDCYLVWFKYV